MAKAAWNRTIVDAAGNVLPGADITVTDERTGTLATLFDDRDGNVAKSNPFVADTNGFATFFADAGVYRVVAESGALSRTWRFQSLLDNAVPITWTEDQIFTGENTFTGDTTLSTVAGDADFTGDIEFSGSTSGPGAMVNGKFVGEVFSIPGNHIAASADFPAPSLTDFLGTKTIDEANFPNLVPFLRAQKLIYLEELTGEAASFSGTVSGSVFTLANNTANNDLVAGLAEWFAANGAYTTIDIGGVTFQITGVNAATRAITVTGTPTGTTAEIYPHRIAGSSTTARLWSWVGKTAIGAGTTETLAMMMRRDHGQQVTGLVTFQDNSGESWGAVGNPVGALQTQSLTTTWGINRVSGATVTKGTRLGFDSADSTAAGGSRVDATTTHSPDVAVHWYQWAGVVTGL